MRYSGASKYGQQQRNQHDQQQVSDNAQMRRFWLRE